MYHMANNSNHHEGLAQELRRGALVLAVLSQLDQPEYGYSLKQALTEKGLDINEGTLYPLLRRLEKQKLLSSDWQVINDARPRRYYQISKEGKAILRQLAVEWYVIVSVMDGLLEDVNKGK